jgi:hypothetical protein
MYFNGYGERKLDFVNDFEASFSSLAVIGKIFIQGKQSNKSFDVFFLC